MNVRDVAVGIALALSIVAFILALWPAVADAPWEKEENLVTDTTVPTELSQAEQCLRLVLAEPSTRTASTMWFIESEGKKIGCW